MAVSGIYIIINKVNNKSYIGSAFNLNRRRYMHIYDLVKDKHHSPRLQNAWNKYGKESFEFKVIEHCDKEDCIKREQYYLDLYKPYYNICLNAQNRSGVKASKETLEKMSIGIKNARGWEKSINVRREGLIKFNKETKSKAIIQFTKDGQFIREFNSIREAGESLGLPPTKYTNISAVCKNKRKTMKGYIWKYKNEYTCQ